MSYVVYSVLLLVNGCFAFWKKHSKIISFTTFLFFWIMFWGNTDNADFTNYINHYNNVLNIKEVNSEVGYYLITSCFARMGFSYHQFIAIITLICYGLIFSTIKEYTENYNYVFLFYIIHLFIFDIIQIRNFMMMSIFIFAIKYLEKNTFRGSITYFILICIATTIHKTGVVYFIALLIKPNNKNTMIKFLAVFSILLTVITYINGGEIPLISNLLSDMLEPTVQSTYLTVSVPLRYLLFLFFLQIMNFITVFLSRNIFSKKYSCILEKNINQHSEDKYNKINRLEKKYKFIDIVFWLNIIAFIFLPLYIESINFYRLMRNLNILNFMVMSICSDSFSSKNIKKIIFNIIALICILSWFMYDLSFSFSHFQRVFENNLIFGR